MESVSTEPVKSLSDRDHLQWLLITLDREQSLGRVHHARIQTLKSEIEKYGGQLATANPAATKKPPDPSEAT
jgi:hypothetical protein